MWAAANDMQRTMPTTDVSGSAIMLCSGITSYSASEDTLAHAICRPGTRARVQFGLSHVSHVSVSRRESLQNEFWCTTVFEHG